MIFKEQLETKEEAIKRLEKELFLLKQEKILIEKQYKELITKYRKQNDELIRLQAFVSKEVENEDKRN